MAIVRSFGTVQAVTSASALVANTTGGGSLSLYGYSQDLEQIYRSQPNVRICVDFLARNIAQLGLIPYRRVSNTDRERIVDHELARWLKYPNPGTTTYRLIEDLMTDLGIYFRAYWLKVRYRDAITGRLALGLLRLPPEEVSVKGLLYPEAFIWTVGGREREYPASEVVHFSGYKSGISPLETLRRILAEEHAAGNYRESLWNHGAKHEGIWERSADSPNWTPEQQRDWRSQWQEFANSSKAGMTAVGMRGGKYVQTSFSAKDSEYIQGGKLRREVCAAMYHIPQPLVGILEHATFSNVKEQHKHLYADTLGPWNEMIVQELERQVLSECADQERVYLEFNIDAKLAGTPEERATSIQMSTGRPWRTVNEARALENLPRIDDPAMDTVAPQQGGPATASQSRPQLPAAAGADDDEPDAVLALAVHAARQRQTARLAKEDPAARMGVFEASLARWDRELASDLTPLVGSTDAVRLAAHYNRQFLDRLKEAADA